MRYEPGEAREWARASLRDYIITTTTPFLADLTIDEKGLRANILRMLNMPIVGGIYVGSIYQEFAALTMVERKRITEVALETVAGRIPVMIGISSNCAADAIELGKHAQEHGADLIMLWPPTFSHRPVAGVLRYFHDVIAKLEIGVCVYASGLSEVGFQLTPSLLAEMVDYDNVCAVKEASKNIATYLETLWRIGDRIVVSAAHEEYWFPGWLIAGNELAPRVLMGSSRPLYLERESAAFLDSIQVEDLPSARASLNQIVRATQLLHAEQLGKGLHNVALTKALSGIAGWAAGPVRPPLVDPSAEEIVRARSVLDKLAPSTTSGLRGAVS